MVVYSLAALADTLRGETPPSAHQA